MAAMTAPAFDTLAMARVDRSEIATKADLAGLEARFYRALLALGAALAGFTVAVAGVAIGLMQALG